MIAYELTQIKAIAFDVDGVLSSGRMSLSPEGMPMRTVNIKDGYAIQLAVKLGLRIAIITGGKAEEVRLRYEGLGVTDIFLGCAVKLTAYEAWRKQHALKQEEIIYVGDDIPDYEIMQLCGCPCCPADATPEIKNLSVYISPYKGGEGCGRDVIEQTLRAKGLWLNNAEAFGW